MISHVTYSDSNVDDIELDREPSATYWRRARGITSLKARVWAAILTMTLALLIGEVVEAHGDRVQVPDPPGTDGGPVIEQTDEPPCWIICPVYGDVAPAEPETPAEPDKPVLHRYDFEAPGFPVDEHGNPVPQYGEVGPQP